MDHPSAHLRRPLPNGPLSPSEQEWKMPTSLSPTDFRNPAVLLSGTVDYEMYNSFRSQLAAAPQKGLIVVELSTLGGDPEVARMMGEDVRYHSDIAPDRHFVFLGKLQSTQRAQLSWRSSRAITGI
jgi:hypothetical protein